MVRRAANAIVRVLLEPACVGCRAILDEPLDGPMCAVCWRSVARMTPPCCERCGDALPTEVSGAGLCRRCQQHPLHLDRCRSAGFYDGALRHAIHAFKYDGRRALAKPLARLITDAAPDLLRDADAVVPVPLAWRRLMSRGFNQSDDLARHLGPPVWRVLRRRRHGPPQAGLAADVRRANVEGAYALGWRTAALQRVQPVTRHWPLPRLPGSTLVLVDDVMTTGATMEACAQALVSAGVREVRGVTVARSVRWSPARVEFIESIGSIGSIGAAHAAERRPPRRQ
jgi:ComF family protein